MPKRLVQKGAERVRLSARQVKQTALAIATGVGPAIDIVANVPHLGLTGFQAKLEWDESGNKSERWYNAGDLAVDELSQSTHPLTRAAMRGVLQSTWASVKAKERALDVLRNQLIQWGDAVTDEKSKHAIVTLATHRNARLRAKAIDSIAFLQGIKGTSWPNFFLRDAKHPVVRAAVLVNDIARAKQSNLQQTPKVREAVHELARHAEWPEHTPAALTGLLHSLHWHGIDLIEPNGLVQQLTRYAVNPQYAYKLMRPAFRELLFKQLRANQDRMKTA